MIFSDIEHVLLWAYDPASVGGACCRTHCCFSKIHLLKPFKMSEQLQIFVSLFFLQRVVSLKNYSNKVSKLAALNLSFVSYKYLFVFAQSTIFVANAVFFYLVFASTHKIDFPNTSKSQLVQATPKPLFSKFDPNQEVPNVSVLPMTT